MPLTKNKNSKKKKNGNKLFNIPGNDSHRTENTKKLKRQLFAILNVFIVLNARVRMCMSAFEMKLFFSVLVSLNVKQIGTVRLTMDCTLRFDHKAAHIQAANCGSFEKQKQNFNNPNPMLMPLLLLFIKNLTILIWGKFFLPDAVFVVLLEFDLNREASHCTCCLCLWG